jgi:hypothetical protein
MNQGRRVWGQVAGVCIVLGALSAAVAGCGRTGGVATPTPIAEPQQAWKVDVLRGQLPAVILVRGKQLCVERLDTPTATPVWTAPAETTPSILAVDPNGGRIAVLLRAAPTITFERAGWFLYPPQWSDAGIVVLSADGSARRLNVQAQTRTEHVAVRETRYKNGAWSISVRPSGLTTPIPGVTHSGAASSTLRSIDATVPDLVTSGAFSGPDIVLTTQSGASYRFGPQAGAPLVLKADGRTLPLTFEQTPTETPLSEVLNLRNGQLLALGGFRSGPVQSQHAAWLARLEGSTLVTEAPPYDVGWQDLSAVASAEGTAAFVYHYEGYVLNEFVTESLVGGAWQQSVVHADSALGFNNQKDFGPTRIEVGAPQAGPAGTLLAPIVFGTTAAPAREATSAVLVEFAANGQGAQREQVRVDREWASTAPEVWRFVERFGR